MHTSVPGSRLGQPQALMFCHPRQATFAAFEDEVLRSAVRVHCSLAMSLFGSCPALSAVEQPTAPVQVTELVRKVCGPDALHWTSRLDAMDQMQSSEVWENWMRSGLTREQFVQFVHRLRIRALKGVGQSLNSKHSRRLSQVVPGAFAVPKGWRVLTGLSAERSQKRKRRIAHRFSNGWSVGTVLTQTTGLKKKRQGRGLWVRYHSKETGRSEDWLHDCNESDYGRFWFMLEKEPSKGAQDGGPVKAQSVVPLPAGMTRSGMRFDKRRHEPSADKKCSAREGRAGVANKTQKARLPITLTVSAMGAGAQESEDLSAYEKSRFANMKRNQEILVALGLAAPLGSEPKHVDAASPVETNTVTDAPPIAYDPAKAEFSAK
jgi:hypothetical protein